MSAKLVTPEEREVYRVRIRGARAAKSHVCLSAAELEAILDAYESLLRANLKMLDRLHPPKETV